MLSVRTRKFLSLSEQCLLNGFSVQRAVFDDSRESYPGRRLMSSRTSVTVPFSQTTRPSRRRCRFWLEKLWISPCEKLAALRLPRLAGRRSG